jgi:DNA-binding transcriptional ArsR family regulator
MNRKAQFGIDSAGVDYILNQMVKFQDAALDRTFAALSDPTRRALVMRLAEQPDISVTELAAPFSMSLPAVMKHLNVLSDAGLVERTKTGRTVACRLDAEPMRDAFEWLNRYEKFWTEQLDRLAAFLDEEELQPRKEESWPPQQPPRQVLLPNQALPSSAGSKPRQPRSTRRGPIPKK